MDKVMKLASQSAVVIFSNTSCGLCYTVKTLFCELGVGPAIYDLHKVLTGPEMGRAVASLVGRVPGVPVDFIGGRLVGSTREVMTLHLGGKLVPLLHDAGALWL